MADRAEKVSGGQNKDTGKEREERKGEETHQRRRGTFLCVSVFEEGKETEDWLNRQRMKRKAKNWMKRRRNKTETDVR